MAATRAKTAGWLLSIALLPLAPGAATAQGTGRRAQAPGITPEADRILRQMSDYLAGVKRARVETENDLDVVTENQQRITYHSESEVAFERPGKLRSHRRGEVANITFFYDGKNFSLYRAQENYYATTPAPPTISAALQAASERLGIDVPAGDLLDPNPYAVLTEDVVAGTYVGRTRIGDVQVHHLAFRGNETDWQIWIEEGPRPLPARLQIVSKKVDGQPTFNVVFRRWDLQPDLPADYFTFTPPPGARQIAFLRSAMPEQKRLPPPTGRPQPPR